MVDNYIMLDGQKFKLDDSFVKLLRGITNDENKINVFTQHEKQVYYYISVAGDVFSGRESDSEPDRKLYSVGNYCTNKSLMEQRALHETLNRLLWRFNEMHGGDVQWDGDNLHAYIVYNRINGEYSISNYSYIKTQGAIYFPSVKRAEEAIETVVKPFVAKHPEFVW